MIAPASILRMAGELKEELVVCRRHLHSYPELSFQEEKTAEYLAQALERKGITVKQGVAGHGLVAQIGNGEGRVVALRADMDALPIQEVNEVSYKSKHAGVMHACGHDVHSTCLLGAAYLLQQLQPKFSGTVKVLFQPAEERIPGGAALMIAQGVLHKPDVEVIFGQHVYPDMEVGNVGFREGMYMASADELYIRVLGKGGHAALPHKAIDAVYVAAQLIVSLQHLVSRRARADLPTVLSIGKVEAAGATNILPDEVRLEGTIRTFDEQWRGELHQLITHLCRELCHSMGADCSVEIRKGYPFLKNDESLTRRAKAVAEQMLGKSQVHDLDLRMTAEDFAWFSHEIPACFYRLGTSNASKKIGAPLHTSQFDVDEDALTIGAAMMAALALEGLK